MPGRVTLFAVFLAATSSLALAQSSGGGAGGGSGGAPGPSSGTSTSTAPGQPGAAAQTPRSGAGIPGGIGAGDTTVTPNLGTGVGNAGIPRPTTGTVGSDSRASSSVTGSVGSGSGSSAGSAGASTSISDPTAPPPGTPRIMVPERR